MSPKPPEPFRTPNTPEARVRAHFAMVEAAVGDARDAALKAAGEADGRVASLIRQVAEQARRIHDLEAANEALRARIPVLMDLVDEERAAKAVAGVEKILTDARQGGYKDGLDFFAAFDVARAGIVIRCECMVTGKWVDTVLRDLEWVDVTARTAVYQLRHRISLHREGFDDITITANDRRGMAGPTDFVLGPVSSFACYVGGEEPKPGDRVRIPNGVADRIVLAIGGDGGVVLKGERNPRPATSLRLIHRQT